MTTTTADLFTRADLEQIAARGITIEEASRQIELLRNPPAAIVLDRPCTIGDGVVTLTDTAQEICADRGASVAAAGRVMKFVPASGAATRMFKELIAAQEGSRPPGATTAVRLLFENLDVFPFAAEVRRRSGIEGMPADETEERAILRVILDEMGYASMPKGLIPFHGGDAIRTPFEEHLLEVSQFATSREGRASAHFTIAAECQPEFEALLDRAALEIEQRVGCRLDVSFSVQDPSTDTLAIDPSGQPFRRSDGTLLLRPGGHGALLHNLQRCGGDVVSIKNIDNVVPAQSSSEVVRWQRITIGLLAEVEAEVRELLASCSVEAPHERELDRALQFAASRFSRRPQVRLDTSREKQRFVLDALDRPLRVCGVVRNEGEPGGAPFWVRGRNGEYSLQIVEGSQVDVRVPQQVEIFRSSTHFNPVNIICSLRSWRGQPFELEQFVDPSSVFIATKWYEGRELRALERPGLWNGGMAGWNTICVEVPASTFAPVKTVLDLLRPQHRPE